MRYEQPTSDPLDGRVVEGTLPLAAAALVSLVSQLAPAFRCFDASYLWTNESRVVADRFDFVARAGEIARRQPQLPVLLVTGEEDWRSSVSRQWRSGTPCATATPIPNGSGSSACRRLPTPLPRPRRPAHTPDPGGERVDAHVTEWLRRHLGG